MKYHLLIFFFFFTFSAVHAQTVAALPDRSKILIGEQIQLQLFGEFKKGQKIDWFHIDSIAHFEIMQKGAIDSISASGSITLKQTLVLTSWDSGQWMIPFVVGAIKTKPVKIDVGYSPMDPAQPYHDIKDILDVDKPAESKWYWWLIFAGLLAILFLLFFPKPKKQELKEFVPEEGAYKKALNQLQQLRMQNLQDAKIFYTELVQIFRTYLEKRKNLRSYSHTTDDLSIQLTNFNISKEPFAELMQTLRLSDLVKYAQFNPSKEEMDRSIDIVEDQIKAIDPIEINKPDL